MKKIKTKKISILELRNKLMDVCEQYGIIGDCGSFIDQSGADFDFTFNGKVYHLEIEQTKHTPKSYFGG